MLELNEVVKRTSSRTSSSSSTSSPSPTRASTTMFQHMSSSTTAAEESLITEAHFASSIDCDDPNALDRAALLPPETSTPYNSPTSPGLGLAGSNGSSFIHNSSSSSSTNIVHANIKDFLDRRRQNLSAFRATSSVRLQRRIRMFDCMKRLGYCLAATTFLLLLVAIPILTVHAIKEYNVGLDIGAFYSAGAFVILTIPISMYEIFLHLTHWYMPDVQKYAVRILWMVPLYSIQSWLSLRYHEFSLFIDTLRDMYEAFVIQSFLYYLIELLGGEEVLAGTLRLKGAQEEHRHHGEHGWCLEPFLGKWEMGEEFMLQCKHGVLQYVVIKVLATILTFVFKVTGDYGEGTMDLTKGYVYISCVTNFSQMYALYVLIKLFYATKHELTHPVDWHPVGKFVCVKGVVFFTWWQGAGIALLQEYGFIIDLGHWTADDVATGVQDYLVCIEMVFFAIAHTFTFTYKEYMNEAFNDPLVSPSAEEFPSAQENLEGGSVRVGGTYRAPPLVRKLAQPQHFSKALWSSSIPSETFSDIYRLQGRNRASRVDQAAINGSGIDLTTIS